MKDFRRIFISLTVLMGFILTIPLFSLSPLSYQGKKNDSPKYIPGDGQKIAYKIVIPGVKTGPNTYKPAKIYNIPIVDKEYYQENTIHIKTKGYYKISKEDKGFRSMILQSSIEDLNIKEIRQPFAKYGEGDLKSADKHGISRIYKVEYSSPVDAYDACKELMKNPEIVYAVPVFMRYPFEYTPNDPSQNRQWMTNKIELKKAWDISKGSKDILIGIVDSGTDTDHEDLKENLWTNPNEIPNNGKDDDENGYVDDVHGWDLARNDSIVKPNDANNNHGTHVAGCAAAVTDNSTGVLSPGFNCSFVPVKVSGDEGGRPAITHGYQGIIYAAELGADVINCSWGGPGSSPAEQDVINQAMDMGAVVVVAAGNDNFQNIDTNPQYPAAYDNVFTVGATANNDGVAGFSNIGNSVNIYAPGHNIYSTLMNNRYGNQSGTSMASPVVAGVMALLKSFKPNWSPIHLMKQIRSTSDDVLTSNPAYKPLFYGRINAFEALDYNGNNPGKNVPGIAITNVEFVGSDAINDYEKTSVNIEVTNYLANASNLKVKLSSVNNFVEFNKTEFNLGFLAKDKSKEFTLRMQLNEMNPWFRGQIKLTLTYESSDYVDYEILNLPILMTSNNRLSTVTKYPNNMNLRWTSAKLTDDNSVWAAGYALAYGYYTLPVYYRYNPSTNSSTNTLNGDPFFSIAPIDKNTVFAVSSKTSGGDARVLKTTNGGNNWQVNNIQGITNFINEIIFFDDREGLFLGDPIGADWGVARSTDGGKNWSRVDNIPPPLNDENGFVGSHFRLGTDVWFGTSKGRVYKSGNKGASWDESTVYNNGFILKLGFYDKNNGIAIYTESDHEGEQLAASTTNGGKTWKKNVFNFSDFALQPVHFFSLPRSDKFYVLCSGGEIYWTDDMGESWTPVLSEQSVGAQSGAVVVNPGFEVKVWEFDSWVSNFNFKYVPNDADQNIELLSDENVEFDTTNIGSKDLQNVEFENTGEIDVHFTELTIQPLEDTEENEFGFFLGKPDYVEPNQKGIVRLQFTPEKEGIRKAKLIVKTDVAGKNYEMNLSGVGIDPSSVPDRTMSGGVVMEQNSPNPAANSTKLNIYLPEPSKFSLEIYNAEGKFMKMVKHGLAGKGNLGIDVNTEDLAPGVYYFRLSAGDNVLTRSFVVSR